jgi:predicted O-linked N-acetylglucosamine transferase (SPINDLY family)
LVASLQVGTSLARNARCACGSGKRYKDCHGSLAPVAVASPEALVRSLALDRRLLTQALADRQRGDLDAARAGCERVLALDAQHPDAWHVLAGLDLEQGSLHDALDKVDRAIRAFPQHAAFHDTRRSILRSLGSAVDDGAEIASLPPASIVASIQRAAALRAAGSLSQAGEALRAALKEAPRERHVMGALAGVLREMLLCDEAAAVYRDLIDLDPEHAARHTASLAECLVQMGRSEEARALCEEALARWPADLRIALLAKLSLKPVYDGADDVAATRRAFAAGLSWLRARVDRFSAVDSGKVLRALEWINFYLAYQGGDDLPLQSAYADFAGDLLDRAVPHLRQPLARREVANRRVRIGFASHFFYDCSAGSYFREWIEALDRARFEIFVYHARPNVDAVGKAIRDAADHFREPRDGVFLGDVIRGDDLDILVYPELGGDGATFLLAGLRLAPVQCAGWGQPVTTGHATIDYFFSSDVMEPADAEEHYRERLVRLPGIGTHYTPPPLPQRLPRAEARERLGLPVDRHLYLFPQSTYKIHPDNDALLADVLAADPAGVVVFFAGHTSETTEQFLRRFARTLQARGLDVADRVVLLPITSRETYLRINMACDVMLDSLHWSGGNTSLDAIAAGLPVVTLPGRFMRGRQTFGMLTVAGVPELIAADARDYVALALRVVGDAAFRESVVERLRAGSAALFDDRSAIDAMQAFYCARVKRQDPCASPRPGSAMPA